MAYCTNCGKEINENAPVCVNCGAEQPQQTPVYSQDYSQDYTQTTQPEKPADKGGFLWGLLGCCIPIAGLILFLVWKDTKPKTAKAAGIGALVSVIISVVYYIIMIALGVGIGVLGL